MNDEFEKDLISRACAGQAEAIDFVNRALVYFHAADDLVDEAQDAEFKIKVLVLGMNLCHCPFYLRHMQALGTAVRMCISTYADSVAWEKSHDPAKREWADQARHCGWDLLPAVAEICGGWTHRRELSRELREYQLSCVEAEKAANAAAEAALPSVEDVQKRNAITKG